MTVATVSRMARSKAIQGGGKVDFGNLKALKANNPYSDEANAEAAKRIDDAMMALNISFSRLMVEITSKCHHQFPTGYVDTMAVATTGEGFAMMMWDSDFVSSLSDATMDTAFVLMHEGLHLFMGHLRTEPELSKSDTYRLAQEACINHIVLRRLNRKNLPTQNIVDPDTGAVTKKPTGVDPGKLYREYAKAVTDPVSFDTFISTDMACYSELMRMPDPPGSASKHMLCVHQTAGEDHGDGQGLPMDQESIKRVVQEALEQVMQDALKGDSKAREEILDLAAATDGTSEEASKMWGNLGLGALRGESIATRKVEWWSRFLRRALASKLRHGGKLVYPRKRAAILDELGFDSPMLHRGAERTKVVVRAIDTSGSMSQTFLNAFFKETGKTTGVEWIDLSFDAVVMPYVAGERVYGGGGTSFQVVQDYVEGRYAVDGKTFDGRYDAIIMVTDGYAPHIQPKDPKKWIWMVTPDGDPWMDGKMDWHTIDLAGEAGSQ